MGKAPSEASTDAERELEAALCQVVAWGGLTLSYVPVHGGISNVNWRVNVDGKSYFVKIPGRGTEMFIDRAVALAAAQSAERLGIVPRNYDYLAAQGIEIDDFLEGRRASTNADFLDQTIRANAIGVYRAFNNSGLLPLTKTIFDMIDEHFDQVRSLGGRTPADFPWFTEQYHLARAALEASGIDLVSCFNDPMPGNFMLDADKSVMLIDYEYASNNDRCYDLGVWCGEMFFDDAVENEIIEAYSGRYDFAMKARLVIHKALADLKWATWAMVQNRVSTLSFDFYKYGVWKHMRA
ncbi:phosphotransferase [Methylocella silvestris]|uniref:Choline/ethanolamine kinase--aminoglycoside phosphotransferase n=1 Tax=Methylocella silvestris TaxID=199596 RepID=A0A2J7TDR1_METSI|nr:phosphotransferase [Methylocella silvestris]PNG24889.1 choline/ethanolamine kinase--aminoglycoside phosphotransferase [Methylocella silvestris]